MSKTSVIRVLWLLALGFYGSYCLRLTADPGDCDNACRQITKFCDGSTGNCYEYIEVDCLRCTALSGNRCRTLILPGIGTCTENPNITQEMRDCAVNCSCYCVPGTSAASSEASCSSASQFFPLSRGVMQCVN
jgi:hypothetical protein